MTIESLGDLGLAAFEADLSDPAEVERLRHLYNVYWDAYHNPPEGVIGVGLITYAEAALIAAQTETDTLEDTQ